MGTTIVRALGVINGAFSDAFEEGMIGNLDSNQGIKRNIDEDL